MFLRVWQVLKVYTMELTFAGVVGVEDLFSSSDVDGRLSLRELSVRENMK